MLGWACVAAWGQDVLLDDFDGGGALEWTDVSPIHSGAPVPTGYFYVDEPSAYFGAANDGNAGICMAQHPMGGNCEAESTPFPITHSALSVALWGPERMASVSVDDVRTGRYVGG